MARALKVGLCLPVMERRLVGRTAGWPELRALALLAEEVGFDSLWLPDHLIFRHPGTEPQGMWEAWSVLCALAAVTSRVELGTLVLCTAFRNPALIAKMASTLDEISAGRLILGLGGGWHDPEFTAFGLADDHKVGRFEEALQIIAPLLRAGRVDFSGDYYAARDAVLLPGPNTARPVPILIGARFNAPRMLRLTAQYADDWNAWLVPANSRPEAIEPLQAAVDAACRKVGRDPSTLRRSAGVLVELDLPEGRAVDPLSGLPRAATPGRRPLTGTPRELAAALRDFAERGIDTVQVLLSPNTVAGIRAFAPVLELLDAGRQGFS